jgi:hypothetical protein
MVSTPSGNRGVSVRLLLRPAAEDDAGVTVESGDVLTE